MSLQISKIAFMAPWLQDKLPHLYGASPWLQDNTSRPKRDL
jgi:hypothetical protein